MRPRRLPSACRAAPRATMAALRRDLQAREWRLLRDRPHAVQPGIGHRHGSRNGRQLSCGRARSDAPRCLLRLKLRVPSGARRHRERRSRASQSSVIRRDGHARSLIKRLEALGARASFVALSSSIFSTLHPSGLSLPGFGSRLPDGVIVRAIAAGSFEAVTRRLGVLHALREQGVLVWNDARAIERCVDKSMTSFLIAQGRPADTRHLDGRRARGGAAHCAARDDPRPPRSQAALRLARARLEADPIRGRPPGGERGRERVLFAALRRRAGPEHSDFRVLVSRGRIVAAMRGTPRIGSPM